MRTIRVDATSKDSINSAIAELQAIKKDWKNKAKKAEEEIAGKLAELITENLSQVEYVDSLYNVKTHEETKYLPMIVAYSKGNTVYISGEAVAFVEFGAGVYHNAVTSNPLSSMVQFDTAIGSYGKGHGTQESWWVVRNIKSRGVPAYMPIYHAIETLKPMIPSIVRTIFI